MAKQTATTRTARLGERTNGSSLAVVIADRMIGDIAAAGWQVGQVVGYESDLLERYRVSRDVLREAIRLLEHLQVARMRHGPGGLVVLPPSVDSVTDAVSVYLFYVGASIEDVFEARFALEELAAELAAEHLDEPQIDDLRELVRREAAGEETDRRRLHTTVAAASGNSALAFLVELLNRVTMLYLATPARLSPDTMTASSRAHSAIVDAVVAGDGASARRRMRKHLEAEAAFLRRRRPSLRRLGDLPELTGRSDKRAEATARRIFQEVAAAGWPVGQLLGSETELMERYGVSRAVLREAVRVLTHHQVARMKRGVGGGLFVVEPGVEAVTEAIALQVDRGGMTPADLFEVREAVEMAVLDRVLERMDGDSEARLLSAIDAERSATPAEFAVVGHDLHAVLAAISGNRVLELLVLVLVRLTRFHSVRPADAPPGARPTEDATAVHLGIVEAILARDGDLARHRSRRHLEALRRWVR